MKGENLDITVLVKATPVLSTALEESMCVAGISSGPNPRWIRLYPVPYRDLEDSMRFKKYEQVRLRVVRPRNDRRPESWSPVEGSLSVVGSLGTEHGWSRRKEVVSAMEGPTMCELFQENAAGSGRGIRSLGVVRPVEQPTLTIVPRAAEKIRAWDERAAAIAAQSSLFGGRSDPKPPLEAVPWVFRYQYRCDAASCRGHDQSIIDWEVVVLYRKVRHRSDWQSLMREKLVDEMWAPGRDSLLYVGNQVQHPQAFLVLGVFWPPSGAIQTRLT